MEELSEDSENETIEVEVKRYITLSSNENKKFKVSFENIKVCSLISNYFDDNDDDDNDDDKSHKDEESFYLSEVSTSTLEQIIELLEYFRKSGPKEITNKLKEYPQPKGDTFKCQFFYGFFSTGCRNFDSLCKTMLAANYLGVDDLLLEVLGVIISSHFFGKMPEQIIEEFNHHDIINPSTQHDERKYAQEDYQVNEMKRMRHMQIHWKFLEYSESDDNEEEDEEKRKDNKSNEQKGAAVEETALSGMKAIMQDEENMKKLNEEQNKKEEKLHRKNIRNFQEYRKKSLERINFNEKLGKTCSHVMAQMFLVSDIFEHICPHFRLKDFLMIYYVYADTEIGHSMLAKISSGKFIIKRVINPLDDPEDDNKSGGINDLIFYHWLIVNNIPISPSKQCFSIKGNLFHPYPGAFTATHDNQITPKWDVLQIDYSAWELVFIKENDKSTKNVFTDGSGGGGGSSNSSSGSSSSSSSSSDVNESHGSSPELFLEWQGDSADLLPIRELVMILTSVFKTYHNLNHHYSTRNTFSNLTLKNFNLSNWHSMIDYICHMSYLDRLTIDNTMTTTHQKFNSSPSPLIYNWNTCLKQLIPDIFKYENPTSLNDLQNCYKYDYYKIHYQPQKPSSMFSFPPLRDISSNSFQTPSTLTILGEYKCNMEFIIGYVFDPLVMGGIKKFQFETTFGKCHNWDMFYEKNRDKILNYTRNLDFYTFDNRASYYGDIDMKHLYVSYYGYNSKFTEDQFYDHCDSILRRNYEEELDEEARRQENEAYEQYWENQDYEDEYEDYEDEEYEDYEDEEYEDYEDEEYEDYEDEEAGDENDGDEDDKDKRKSLDEETIRKIENIVISDSDDEIDQLLADLEL